MNKTLVLQIAIPAFNADDLPEYAKLYSEPDDPTPSDYLAVVTEEWIRVDCGVFLVSLPGEKCGSDDFVVGSFDGHIIGATVIDREDS